MRMCICVCVCMRMCLYAYVYMCMCLYVCVCNSRGRILVWSGKCQSKQKVVWSSADIDQLFYITCTLLSGILIKNVSLPVNVATNLQTGTFPCSKSSCNTCQHMPSTSFNSKTTGEKFWIRHKFSCKSRNVIYLIACSVPKCKKQYVGKTKQKLSDRISQHLGNINLKRGSCIHKHFFLSFTPMSRILLSPVTRRLHLLSIFTAHYPEVPEVREGLIPPALYPEIPSDLPH